MRYRTATIAILYMGAAIIGLYLQYVLKTSLNPTNKKYLVNVDKLLKEILKVVFIYQTNSIYTTYSIYIPIYTITIYILCIVLHLYP